MSLTDEERSAIVDYRIEKAYGTLADIRQLVPLAMWGIIASRMYYALYYAATALLINDGNKVSTHKGVIAMVNLNYVKNGPLTRDDGILIGRIFAFRQGSDYDDFFEATENDVAQYLPQVEKLVAKLISLINERPIE